MKFKKYVFKRTLRDHVKNKLPEAVLDCFGRTRNCLLKIAINIFTITPSRQQRKHFNRHGFPDYCLQKNIKLSEFFRYFALSSRF